MNWFRKRRERKETLRAIEIIYQQVEAHISGGGRLESLLAIPLWEAVEWDKERQSWFVEVVDGGESSENGFDVLGGGKLPAGQWVSLMSGRGGRMEDAVVVSGRKIYGGYRYFVDFSETGGSEPWFLPLLNN